MLIDSAVVEQGTDDAPEEKDPLEGLGMAFGGVILQAYMS